MKKNFKVLLIPLVVVAFLSVSCGSLSTPAPTQTALPTYTSQPTYTPQPTYTEVPTKVPTKVPTYTSVPPISSPSTDYIEIDCPDISQYDLPGLIGKCYALNISPVAVGVLLYSGNQLVIINVTWDNSAPESVTKKAATFLVTEAMNAGWNVGDLKTLTNMLADTPEGETIKYGELQARWSSEDYMSITYGLSSFFGN